MKLTRYPATYNPILEYWQAIQDGREVVSLKVQKTYRHVVEQLENSESEFYYSPRRANHVLEFFENYCHHSKGKAGGQLVKLELWEKALLATVFGFIDIEGNRQYREAILIVGKKNGKSLLASGVGLYLQLADGEAGPEVYAVATKRDQAKIIWQEAKRMVQKSPALRKRTRCLAGEVDSDYNDGVFKPLSSDSDTLDGLNIHGAMMDELHQWKNGRPLYDIVADGDQARAQPLRFITSTAGTIREDIYDEKYEEAERIINGYEDPDGYHDPRRIAFIYELDGIGGADLSKTTDLTAAKVIFQVPELPDILFVLQMYWLPQELLEKRVTEDKIPYDKWHERGLLRLSEGNKIRYEDVKAWFVEVQENLDIFLPFFGYDAWSATYWVDSMADYFGAEAMIPVHQGVKTLSEPMKRCGNDLKSKRIIYNNHPIDKWNLANTAYEEDKNGNIQPRKTSKSTRRIDGTAALLDAYAIYDQKQAEYTSML